MSADASDASDTGATTNQVHRGPLIGHAAVVIIRREEPADREAIRSIHRAAFAHYYQDTEPVEPGLVDELWADGDAVPPLCLVALEAGQVVGHVMGSRAVLDPARVPAVGLGPLGVRPDLQSGGIGGALMHAVIAAADATGEPLIGLLGEPAYYRRFGFVTSTDHGVEPPDPAWGEYFQVRPLTGWPRSLDLQVFRYAAAFDRF